MDSMREAYRAPKPLPIAINGLSGGATTAYLVEAAIDATQLTDNRSVLVLCHSQDACAEVTARLCASGLRAYHYKHRAPVLHNISASHDVERERLSVLFKILSGEAQVVVSTPSAALSLTMPQELLSSLSLSIRQGSEISPEELSGRLSALGFAAVDAVEERGQFAKRGGIVDFFGADMDMPVRCEFFGDEVDRLAVFDVMTQRTLENIDEITLLPAREVIVSDEARGKMCTEVEKLLRSGKLSDEMRERLTRERTAIQSGVGMDFRDKYLPLIYEGASLLSYIGSRTVILMLGTAACLDEARGRLKRLEDEVAGLVSVGAISPRFSSYSFGLDTLEKYQNDNITLHVNQFSGGVGNIKLWGLFGLRTRPTVSYGENIRMLTEDLSGLSKNGYRTYLLVANRSEAESLSSTLAELGVTALSLLDEGAEDTEAVGGGVYITVGDEEGFDLISPRIAVLSMARADGRSIVSHRRKQRIQRKVGGTQRLMSHADLSVGDYVVHSSYGIGQFEGIEAVTIDGVTRDYITIRYAGTDKLFVPCERLEVLGKYIGDRDKDGRVKLSKMGGTEWTRAKSRAKEATRELAKKLIAIYAERQRRPGFAFPKQSELEDRFEEDFEYEETESQLTAIEEIKADMIRPVPMNRLLCGDVGFGKTEVALRAAFKAILGGKQVAILVPTTILALQHYQTALSRMRGYAVSVEMLSRFRTPKQRKEIIDRTKRGRVDILIGTHSIISKSVEFRDLGLLIIDEEQRFGVAQKERLREMATDVDTLMLSATPIPRTLNMAMSGISDISVLDEAPGDRHPVQTYVMEHDDGIILDAISRELDRRGQVLYLYNKIEDIDLVAGRIQERLPEARVTYAHGRMEKEELEDIWQCLVRGEIDVLVCTTIIETGVDLPSANTLIIENADRFGLSQLHQIRGRVGRSERQAYAYLTYRPGKALSEVAEKRLEAIREFAEFGAGFKIALRDMEIRGAGNLLGPEQHGYIESVGYDLYVKLLNEAVLEENGESKPDVPTATVSINLSAYIPEGYIPSAAARMEMYKKIALVETAKDREDIIDEFCDRFGDMPLPVRRLVDVALTKALAERAGIRKVEVREGKISFLQEKPRLDIWSELFALFPRLSFLGVGSPLIVYKLHRSEEPCELCARILSKYVELMEE